jgi:hypothetical protein
MGLMQGLSSWAKPRRVIFLFFFLRIPRRVIGGLPRPRVLFSIGPMLCSVASSPALYGGWRPARCLFLQNVKSMWGGGSGKSYIHHLLRCIDINNLQILMLWWNMQLKKWSNMYPVSLASLLSLMRSADGFSATGSFSRDWLGTFFWNSSIFVDGFLFRWAVFTQFLLFRQVFFFSFISLFLDSFFFFMFGFWQNFRLAPSFHVVFSSSFLKKCLGLTKMFIFKKIWNYYF